jgi:hypothetical protein
MYLIDTNRGTYRVFPVTERFQAKEIGKPKARIWFELQ